MPANLNVNIDHVATVREARKTTEPSILEAADICEKAGAHGITVHIRGDRRHIQDRDIEQLGEAVSTYLNVEMAATDEMITFAERIKPDAVSLVPESPNEITTEGGLDVISHPFMVKTAVERLKAAGIFVSIFIDPDTDQLDAAKLTGADQVELCTAEYAHVCIGTDRSHAQEIEPGFRPDAQDIADEVERIRTAAAHAKSIGLIVAAGHGLTTANIKPLAAMPEITEFNIGHHIISRAIFVGLENAVKEMLVAIKV